MAKIDIYTTMLCPYCFRAKGLLNQKGADFNEIPVDMDAAKRREMVDRAGGAHTVPQIFINDVHVGGCDELMALDSDGKLDPMLVA